MGPEHSQTSATAPGVTSSQPTVAAVIPAYRTPGTILDVLSRFDASVARIFVVDDDCPQGTGHRVREANADPRVSVIFNERNLGVGGATAVGFQAAFAAGADIVAKVDGDGQHRPEWLPALVAPIVAGDADMAKGNRFADLAACLRTMPASRLVANAALSAVSRPATGYWRVSDPACGFLALHRKIVGRLPWEQMATGYFFESDLLFRLGMLDAAVVEVPVAPVYSRGAGASGVRLWREAVPFARGSLRNFARRLRDHRRNGRVAITGLLFLLGGLAVLAGVAGAPPGEALSSAAASHPPVWLAPVRAAALGSAVLGVGLIAEFFRRDFARQPRRPIHPRLDGDRGPGVGRTFPPLRD